VKGTFVLAWLPLALVVALTLLIFYLSFIPRLPTEPGFTLDHWRGITGGYIVQKVIPNTFGLGVGALAVALFFALPLAWLLNRTTLPYRETMTALVGICLAVPSFVVAMAWIILLNAEAGFVNNLFARWLGVAMPLSASGNLFGISWVLGLVLSPGVFFLISGPIRQLPASFEEAALVTGATRWKTVVRITLPLVWPGILGGIIYFFMTAISIFEVPAMLGARGGQVPVLSTELFFAVHPATGLPSFGAAGVYGVLITGFSLWSLYFYHRVISSAHRYSVISGKGYQPRLTQLGRWAYLAWVFAAIYFLFALILPLLIMIWLSLLPILKEPSLSALSLISFDNYGNFVLLIGGVDVIWNTAWLVGGTTLLVIFFSFLISWYVVRSHLRVGKIMDTVALLPHAIPSVALAFSLFMAGLVFYKWIPWLPLYGTIGIIVIAHLISRISYGTRVMNAALLQVHSELEESARVCGAREGTVMWKILVPLVRPSIFSVGILTALLSFREVTMALLLSGPENAVLATRVWLLWQGGRLTEAAAGAVILAIVSMILVVALLAMQGKRESMGVERASAL